MFKCLNMEVSDEIIITNSRFKRPGERVEAD